MHQAMKITIFDLDDTLVQTDALITVTNRQTGITSRINAKQFNKFGRDDSKFQYDFSEFRDPVRLLNGTIFEKTLSRLEDLYGFETIGCITAREDVDLVQTFFANLKFPINRDLIYVLNGEPRKYFGPVPKMKAWAVSQLIDRGFKEIQFFEDSIANLNACQDICDMRNVKFRPVLVDDSWK